jgi:hypothetical protein
MTGKLTIEVESFTPRQSNTLRGFCTIIIPALHLRVCDITVHQKGSSRWVGLPGKPIVDRYGVAKRSDDGKLVYVPIVEFVDKPTRDAFSERVIAAVLEDFPNAFECQEAA